MDVGGTRSNEWIMIGINDHETSEYRLMPADDPFAEPKLVAPREIGLQYDLEEGGDIFFILTNADGAKDFKIMTAPAADPARANWQELVPHEPGRLILSVIVFKDFLVRLERKDGLPRIVVRERAQRRGASHRLRRGGLLARPVRLLRIRHRDHALLLFVDDDAGAGLRLQHAHPRARAAEDPGSAVRP